MHTINTTIGTTGITHSFHDVFMRLPFPLLAGKWCLQAFLRKFQQAIYPCLQWHTGKSHVVPCLSWSDEVFLYKCLCVSGLVESTSKHAVHTKTPWRWVEYDGIINWFGAGLQKHNPFRSLRFHVPFSRANHGNLHAIHAQSLESASKSSALPDPACLDMSLTWNPSSLSVDPQPWYPRKYGRTIPLNGLCWGYLRCFKWLVWLP